MNIHPYYFSAPKRIFDAVLSAGLLAGLSPLFLIIGMGVFLTSGQPVIFRQKRTGKNGVVFILFKFRTMKKNAAVLKHRYQHLNEAPAPMFKIHNDPRLVGIGKLLSRIGLDELPQLWNILKGEMSFVGPRPLPVNEASHLPTAWKQWRERVKPGIFSEWALSGERHENLEQWRRLEKQTLRRGSLLKDLFYVVFTPLSQIILTISRIIRPAKSL